MSIICDHVSYIYSAGTSDEIRALDDVSFKIDDGEFVGLIGHTGSGKSTLVQHLNGLLKATDGHIYFNGRDIYDADFSMKELRGNVGLVFQYPEHQLFEENVFKDVCFGPSNLGLSKKETELRAYAALKDVGIQDDYFYVSPFDLSGGQKRRVAIAGVLAMKPEILVLDEATSALDTETERAVMEAIDRLHGRKTLLIIAHRLTTIRNCDMIFRVENSRVVKVDRSDIL